jgi:AraC-like DNA-binding protein
MAESIDKIDKTEKTQAEAYEGDIQPELNYLVKRECLPTWQIESWPRTDCDMTYIIKGKARYTINNISYEVSAGDLVCMSTNDIKEAITYPDDLMHCFAVNFKLTNPQGFDTRLPFPPVSHIGLDDELINQFHELVFVWTAQSPGYTIKAKGLLLLILYQLLDLAIYNKSPATADFRIKRVLRHISQHYSEKITVKKMADLFDMNAAYFGKLFMQETGTTINKYLTKIRIRNAVSMLRSGSYTVGEAAEQTGFIDTNYFYKQFKRIMGFSPSSCVPKSRGAPPPPPPHSTLNLLQPG